MNLLTVDFETYYDTEFSLSKIQTDAYILDERYETIMVSVKENNGEPQWFSGTEEETKNWLMQFPWERSAVVCHNTLFDGFILTQRFGIRPKLWMDTLAMARFLYPWMPSHSLAALAKFFGMEDKGTTVASMIGRRRADMSPVELAAYAAYCMHDVELCHALCVDKSLNRMPTLELRLIDMTIRMFTEPQFVGDRKMMLELYNKEVARKDNLIEMAGLKKEDLMSNQKLAAALEGLNVTIPMKISPTTGKQTFAFAKSDKEFKALLEHDLPVVQAIVAARLGVKTTISETRAQRMAQAADRPCLLRQDIGTGNAAHVAHAIAALEDHCGFGMPVYLNYWGAKTTGRYSGGNKVNWQNLPARGLSAGLRKAVMAPPGQVIVVGDSANIELRVAMYAAGQEDVTAMIEQGEDLYCAFATKMFGRTITKADKMQRMLGKLAMLSLQYGAGWRKFKEMVRIQTGETLNDDVSEATVNLYRRVHDKILDMWERFDIVILPEIHNGCLNMIPVDTKAWCIATGEGFGVGGGQGVVYKNLRREQGENSYGKPTMEWVYDMGREKVKLYGGKCLSGESLVFTDMGWKRLDAITTERVHDGVKFVAHGGIVFNGFKTCTSVDGVLMTPDHKVMTDEGWKTALEKPRPYRPAIWSTARLADFAQRREENVLGVPMFVWKNLHEGWIRGHEGTEAGRDTELWLSDHTAYLQGKCEAWDEQAPRVCGMAQYAGSLPATYASRMGKLRRAWNNGMRSVAAVIREFLGGHGANLPSPVYTGASQQHRGLFSNELRVGNIQGAGAEQAQLDRAGLESVVGEHGYTEVDALLQTAARPVFDIVNCGPRHRFVVLGEQGPFIVHNCFENYCQHVARQIVMWQTARINERYPVALSVHDEAVCVVKESEADAARAYMEECLSLAPPWCRGQIALACETGVGPSYGDAK